MRRQRASRQFLNRSNCVSSSFRAYSGGRLQDIALHEFIQSGSPISAKFLRPPLLGAVNLPQLCVARFVMCSTNEAVPKKVDASNAYQKQQHRKNQTLPFQASYFNNSSAI